MKSTQSLLSALVLVGLCLGACTKKPAPPVEAGPPRTPEQTVEQFVRLSAEATAAEDKGKLQSLCSGELRRAFDRMTDEMFKISYLAGKVKVKSFKILEARKDEPEKAVVRYQIAIENLQGTDKTEEVNEREVELVFADSNWFIEAIKTSGSDRIAFTQGMMF